MTWTLRIGTVEGESEMRRFIHPRDEVERLSRRARRVGDEPPRVQRGELVFSVDMNCIVPLMEAIDAIGRKRRMDDLSPLARN